MKTTTRRWKICPLLFLICLLIFAQAVRGEENSYLVGEGDVLQITVWKNPEISRTVTVRPDGMITLPLVNDLFVSGHTTEEIRNIITEGLSGFINSPNVSVSIDQARSYRVFTLGALASKGTIQLSAPITPFQLLARVGGAAPDADLSRALIIRGTERIPVNLERQLGGAGEKEDFMLPGDILMIPTRKIDMQRVLVVGEVRVPQPIPFRDGMTVLDAFLAAGGATEAADLEKVKVARPGPEGRNSEISINLENVIKKGDLHHNVNLVAGDVIVVPYREVKSQRILVLGEVKTPRSVIYKEGMTALDAFVEAGGGTNFADVNKTKVIRLIGGKKKEIRVDLDKIMKKGDLSQNIILYPGDIIVVP